MATSATRRILHIQEPHLSAINDEQLAFETSGDLSYFQTKNGFWGGKNSYSDITRFSSYDDIVRHERIHFKDAIVILPSGDDQPTTTAAYGGTVDDWNSPRPAASINIGGRAGSNATVTSLTSATDYDCMINIGIDTAKNCSAVGNTPINIGGRAGKDSYLSNGTINIGLGAGAGGTDSYIPAVTYGILEQADTSSDVISGSSVNIGYQAGWQARTDKSISIGIRASEDVELMRDSIGIGREVYAGSNIIDGSVGIGFCALSQGNFGGDTSAANTVAIGYHVGVYSESSYGVMLGSFAGQGSYSDRSIMLGYVAGQDSNGVSNFIAGDRAGIGFIGDYNISIGYQAGSGSGYQKNESIMIGLGNSMMSTMSNSISLGRWANEKGNLSDTISIGDHALGAKYTDNTIAIGNYAGATSAFIDGSVHYVSMSAVDCVLIGTSAGFNENLDSALIVANGDNELIRGSFTDKRLGVKSIVNFNPVSSASVSTPQPGDVIFDSGTSKLICWNGSNWNALWD